MSCLSAQWRPPRPTEVQEETKGVRSCVCVCGGGACVWACVRVWWSVTTNLARLDQRLRHVHHSLELYRIGGEEPILVLMVSVLCFGKAHDQQVGTYSLKYSTAAWVRFINST